jgi:outer membrane protein OmpA-like peptidoglycan-associated protein
LQRKCACGGAAAGPSGECEECSNRKIVGLQTKLRINEPGDIHEQEADRVAEQVMRMPASEVPIAAAPVQISRKCAACEEEGKLQKKETETVQASGGEAPARVHEVLHSPGQPLDAATRAYFEPRFGRDFSRVRVHADAAAGHSAREINAHAYTVGHNVVFGVGRFAPATHEGRRLIAHELTHVVQQSGLGHAARQPTRISNAHDADARAKVAATCVLPMRSTESTLAVQRQPAPPTPKLTRAEEVRLSFTSPGEIEFVPNPPTLSLYNFAINDAVLKEKHVAALLALASLIKQFAGGKLSVEAKGHADSTGEDTVNDPLSEHRAQSAQKALVSAAGVPVPIDHCGVRCPAATNDTVEGRSRNRRVDIRLNSNTKGDDLDWPSLCALMPKVCLCLENPALCEDDDGGIDWPSLCPGPLGKLICIGVVCLLAAKLCLSQLCRLFPELCLATLCKVFPSLCKRKPSKDDEPKRKRACPIKVDLPSGDKQARKIEQVGYAKLWYPFKMNIDFDEDSSGCECACGEYKQLVRGHDEVDKTGKGDWKPVEVQLSLGENLDKNDFKEDGHIAFGPYGHRYWDDETRIDPKPNVEEDRFLSTRETGCRYRGLDAPELEVRLPYPARIRTHTEFVGGPVDVCMTPGQRIGLQQHWRSWTIDGEAQVKPPSSKPKRLALGNLIAFIFSQKAPKEGQEVTLEIRRQGDPESCFGAIPAGVIMVDDLGVKCMTHNSERVQIAPEGCPENWIPPFFTITAQWLEETTA